MRKILSLFLILLMMICFASCGGSEDVKDVQDNDTITESDQTNTPDTEPEKEKIEITVESLKNAPETDPSQFEFYDGEEGIEITNYIGTDEIVVVPEKINGKSVVKVGGAFINAETVRGVRLADTVEVLGENAFVNSESIELIVTGKGLKTIERYAISCCPNLKTVELNDGLEVIDVGGIALNENLKEIYIPGSVTTIYYAPADDCITYCEAGSATEEYAKSNGFKYEIK